MHSIGCPEGMSESGTDAPADSGDVDIYLAYQPLVGPFEHLEQRLVALGADLPDLLRLHTVVCLHRPGSQVQGALAHCSCACVHLAHS